VTTLIHADGGVRLSSNPACLQAALHGFVTLDGRQQLGHQQEYEDQKETEEGNAEVRDI
jgi:hypothetical protein